MYNQFGLECSNPTLRNLFIKQHAEVSKHNFQIFTVMKDKDLYPVTEAEEQDISTTIEMHSDMQDQLEQGK